MNYLHHPLPGEGYLAVCAALELPGESNLADVLAEIARLKMAAAEGPRPVKPLKSLKSLKPLKDTNDYSDHKELA